MSDHLRAWLEAIFARIEHPGSGVVADEHAVALAVAGFVLGHDSDEELTFEDVSQQLRAFYNVSDNFSLESDEFLEYVLIHAVSEHCSNRAECVEEIVNLDQDAQVYLMEVIQSFMLRKTDVEDTSEMDLSRECVAAGDDRPHLVEVETPLADEVCESSRALHEEIALMKRDLETQRLAYQKEVTELKQKLSSEGHHLEDLEVSIFEKDRVLFQLQKQIDEYEAKLKDMDKLAHQLSQARASLAVLQDEVDVIRPQAQRADALEANLTKMREKLEEYSEVRQQLKVEVASHQETYSKLVAAEQELGDLRPLKQQLDEYREDLAEAKISTEELSKQVDRQSAQLRDLEAERARLTGGAASQLREQETLAQELRAASEELRAQSRFQGVGEGISELNPALMQELHRLRTDNGDLLVKLSKCSTESLAKLEKEIADVKCVNSSLQQKWTKAKDQLAGAEKLIADLQLRLLREQEAVADLRQRLAESVAMAAEEARMLRALHAKADAFLREQARAQASLLAQGLGLVARGYRDDRDSLQELLDQSTAHGIGLDEELRLARGELEQKEEELAEAGHKRRRLEEESEERVQRAKLQHEQTLQALAVEHQQTLAAAQTRADQGVAAEAQRAVDLAAKLEDEVQKRRRLDRTKKLLETELQRLKVQLNGVGCGEGSAQAFNGDFSLAAKELKTMQEQIDSQQAEIAVLRQQLAARPAGPADDMAIEAQGSRVSSLRSRAVRVGAVGAASTPAPGGASQSIQSFIEQTELNDKRVEQLSREKREILSKSLEDSKEKVELSQKLSAAEKENGALKSELRKVRLDKERLERKLMKTHGVESLQEDKENVHLNASQLY